MKLTTKQTKAYDFLNDAKTVEVGFGGGAGGGKSVLGCLWQIEKRLKYPKTRGLIGRSKLKTLKETTLMSFFDVAKKQGLQSGVHYKYREQGSRIEFYNGSIIFLKDLFFYPSDPEFDELGSLELTDAYLDETAQITRKAFTITKTRIRYQLNENDLIPKILWTSNPSKNWNYTDFYLPYRKNELPDYRKFIPALAKHNPYLPKHYIETLDNLPKNERERLRDGNWEYDDDPTALIDYDKLMDIWSNDFVKGGEMYISADIARFGQDSTVIGIWDGWQLIEIIQLKKKDLNQVSSIIDSLRIKNNVPLSNVIADEDGLGGGVIDFLGCKGFVNNSRPLNDENYSNLKSQCYFRLAEKINRNEIFIKSNSFEDKINEELEQVKQHNMDKDGKKQIIPKERVKETLGRSPDFSDMIAMRVYFDIQEKPKETTPINELQGIFY